MSDIAGSGDAESFWTGPLEYRLPPELIAQHPAPVRSDSRLMVVNRASGAVEHQRFADLPELLRSDDLLVGNDSRVFPARLAAVKDSGGAVEILLLSVAPDEAVPAMLRSSKAVKDGAVLTLTDGSRCKVVRLLGEGRYMVAFERRSAAEAAAALGSVPLPPYISRPDGEEPGDRERYQTVYARDEGSVAAPTAGLHFTEQLLRRLNEAGVDFTRLTLHVGPGTFMPIRGRAEAHRMEGEWCRVGGEAASRLEAARTRGGRVVAVGTTAVRALESAARESGTEGPASWEGTTDLFIKPGHTFRAVDAMITNLHLPASSLLCLVMAFAGEELVRAAYELAVRERYRFYSYGDAMLIV